MSMPEMQSSPLKQFEKSKCFCNELKFMKDNRSLELLMAIVT